MSRGHASELAHLALGHDPLDRRADLRPGTWSAVPGPRVLLLLDGAGRAAVLPSPNGSVRLAVVPGDRSPAVTPGYRSATGTGPVGSAAAREARPVGPIAGVAPSTRTDPARDAETSADILLGADDSGRMWCGRVVARDDPVVPREAQWANLRDIALRLPADERGILAELTALANWHRTHEHCPRCGARTAVAGLGWWRTCPQDGSEHYPRTDPAVIALLLDEAGNALLGRQSRWPEGAFSTLAGFVEPGESAESAVVREIAEEVGLDPSGTRYIGSQPWPFPASLMLGYHATIGGIRPEPAPDGVEILEARWVSRDHLGPLCEAREVRLPSRSSIAHHLIRLWYGQPLPDRWCRW